MLRHSVRQCARFSSVAFAQFAKDLTPTFVGVDPSERAAVIFRRFDGLHADDIAALEQRARESDPDPAVRQQALALKRKRAQQAASENRKAVKRALKQLSTGVKSAEVKEARRLKAKERMREAVRERKQRAKARAQRMAEAAMAQTLDVDGEMMTLNRDSALLDAEAKLKKAVAVCDSPLSAASIAETISAVTRTTPQTLHFALKGKMQPRQPGTAYRRFVRSCKGRADLAGKSGPERMRLIAMEFRERKAAGTLP